MIASARSPSRFSIASITLRCWSRAMRMMSWLRARRLRPDESLGAANGRAAARSGCGASAGCRTGREQRMEARVEPTYAEKPRRRRRRAPSRSGPARRPVGERVRRRRRSAAGGPQALQGAAQFDRIENVALREGPHREAARRASPRSALPPPAAPAPCAPACATRRGARPCDSSEMRSPGRSDPARIISRSCSSAFTVCDCCSPPSSAASRRARSAGHDVYRRRGGRRRRSPAPLLGDHRSIRRRAHIAPASMLRL